MLEVAPNTKAAAISIENSHKVLGKGLTALPLPKVQKIIVSMES